MREEEEAEEEEVEEDFVTIPAERTHEVDIRASFASDCMKLNETKRREKIRLLPGWTTSTATTIRTEWTSQRRPTWREMTLFRSEWK